MINWEFVGAIVGIASLVITFVLEWPRLTSRFGVNTSVKKIILRIIMGISIGVVIGSVVGVLLYLAASYISTQFNLQINSFSYVIKRSISFWAIGVAIISVLGATRENIYSANARIILRGLLFGFMFGLSVGLVVYTLYYSLTTYYNSLLTILICIAEDTITTSIGCALVGAIFGGMANKVAKFLFTTD